MVVISFLYPSPAGLFLHSYVYLSIFLSIYFVFYLFAIGCVCSIYEYVLLAKCFFFSSCISFCFGNQSMLTFYCRKFRVPPICQTNTMRVCIGSLLHRHSDTHSYTTRKKKKHKIYQICKLLIFILKFSDQSQVILLHSNLPCSLPVVVDVVVTSERITLCCRKTFSALRTGEIVQQKFYPTLIASSLEICPCFVCVRLISSSEPLQSFN